MEGHAAEAHLALALFADVQRNLPLARGVVGMVVRWGKRWRCRRVRAVSAEEEEQQEEERPRAWSHQHSSRTVLTVELYCTVPVYTVH